MNDAEDNLWDIWCIQEGYAYSHCVQGKIVQKPFFEIFLWHPVVLNVLKGYLARKLKSNHLSEGFLGLIPELLALGAGDYGYR